MATMPPSMPAPMGGQPTMPGAENAMDDMKGGYEICIQVSPDGKITVGVESGGYEAAEEQGAEAAGMKKPDMKPVADFQEAIKTAMDIYKANGKMVSTEGEAEGFGASFSA